jgi:hypothetical protein
VGRKRKTASSLVWLGRGGEGPALTDTLRVFCEDRIAFMLEVLRLT